MLLACTCEVIYGIILGMGQILQRLTFDMEPGGAGSQAASADTLFPAGNNGCQVCW